MSVPAPAILVEPLLRMRGIHKHFPGVHVLRGIDFEVQAGEVHALCGENGAGKSTLMNLLAGVHQPDAGEIEFDGQAEVKLPSSHAAQQLGISIVFQERSLFHQLSVAENIFAGRQPVRAGGRIDWSELRRLAAAALTEVGLTGLDPQTQLGELGPATQQMVEVAKALSLNARLIIFDEPTAALTETETQALFRVIAQLKQRGTGVIYISHRLEEIFQIADRVTVLKDGSLQGTSRVAQTTPSELVARMVGRELELHERKRENRATGNPVALEVRGLTDASEYEGTRPFLRNIGFEVRQGEIVALAGLAGAGRTETALSLFGARQRAAGEIRICGSAVEIGNPAEAIRAGLGYAPEDRKESGLFLDMSISQNICASRLEQFGTWRFDDAAGEALSEGFREQLQIACRSVTQQVGSLSGGNQQKVVLAKWLLVAPKILIVDEPTRGVDVGAKAEVHRLLRKLAAQGTALLVISSDLPEVLALADRIVVMREGRIAGELAGAGATEEAVMRLAAMRTEMAIGV